MAKRVPISYSRESTFKSCSLKYQYHYIEKHPSGKKDYFELGTLVHLVFECLVKPRHKKHFDIIHKHQDVKRSPAVVRLINKHYQREIELLKGRLDDIYQFVLNGLNFDFLCEGCEELLDPELDFYLEEEDFTIRGFIDKSAIYKGYIRIGDYKTSKRKKAESDKKFDHQALIYCVALRKIYGRFEKYIIDFIFVKFDNPGFTCEYTNREVDMMEEYLAKASKAMTSFDESNLFDRVPKRTPLVHMHCGKEKGQLNAKGLPAHICSFKYPYFYYVAYKDGKIVKTAFDKKDLSDYSNIELKHFKGCHAWRAETEARPNGYEQN